MGNKQLTSIIIKTPNENPNLQESLLNLGDDARLRIEKILEHPQADILNDQPVVDDSLGMKSLVKTLSEIVLSENTQTPITINVNGKWGTGKTSILRMIEKDAKLLNVPCLWLNAWSLDSTESLIASTASEIQENFTKKSEAQSTISNMPISKFLLVAESFLAATSSIILGSLTGKKLANVLGELANSVQAKVETDVIQKSQKRNIQELASVVTARRTFSELIQYLISESETKGDRVIVFIDDMDRALPDQITNILKNLKLILEVPNCVFILGMDQEIVANAIETHYFNKGSSSSSVRFEGNVVMGNSSALSVASSNKFGEKEGFGYKYLDKLVQLVVDVPGLTRRTGIIYLESLNIHPDIIQIVNCAPDEDVLNPRSLKRYINWLSMSLQLIVSIGMPDGLSNFTALRLLALRRDYPEIYQWLVMDYQFTDIRLNSQIIDWLKIQTPDLYDSLLLGTAKSFGNSTLEFFEDNYRQFYDQEFGDIPRKHSSDVFEKNLDELLGSKVIRVASNFIVSGNNILPFIEGNTSRYFNLRNTLLTISTVQKHRDLHAIKQSEITLMTDFLHGDIEMFRDVVDSSPLMTTNISR